MIRSIFFKNLWERKISTLTTGGSLMAVSLLYAYLYESFSSDLVNLGELIPPELAPIVGDLSAATTPEGWLNLEFFQVFFPIVISIVAIMTGAAIIGNEEKSGTLELLLTRPISRGRIYLEKSMTICVQMGIVNLLAFLGVVLGKALFPFDVDLGRVFIAQISAWLLSLVFGYFALMIQSILPKKSRAIGIGSAFLGISYLTFAISKIVESLNWLEYLSFFYYYDIENILLESTTFWNFLILFGAGVLFNSIGLMMFTQRDTGV